MIYLYHGSRLSASTRAAKRAERHNERRFSGPQWCAPRLRIGTLVREQSRRWAKSIRDKPRKGGTSVPPKAAIIAFGLQPLNFRGPRSTLLQRELFHVFHELFGGGRPRQQGRPICRAGSIRTSGAGLHLLSLTLPRHLTSPFPRISEEPLVWTVEHCSL
jgi:hypothetical protein